MDLQTEILTYRQNYDIIKLQIIKDNKIMQKRDI